VGLIESEKTYSSSGAASGAYTGGIVPAFHTQHCTSPTLAQIPAFKPVNFRFRDDLMTIASCTPHLLPAPCQMCERTLMSLRVKTNFTFQTLT